ncbi:MAG: hypothetical protein Kow0029_27640 [Candidatus Rifleibacteriota bacterium]
MKKLLALILVFICSNTAIAEKLFQYRGIFPAKREANAEITNYILLKKGTSVNLSIEEQGTGPTDRVKISEMKLTSDPRIIFSSETNFSELKITETGIYQVKLVPVSQAGGEIKFILNVRETEPGQTGEVIIDGSNNVISSRQSHTTDQTDIGSNTMSAVSSDENTEYNRVEKDLSAYLINKESIGKIETVADVDNVEKTASDQAYVASDTQIISLNQVAGGVASQTADEPEIKIIAPAEHCFINPFNGLRFSFKNLPKNEIRFFEDNIEIFLMSSDGKNRKVEGNFFISEPGVMTFLPVMLRPGAVYHVNNLLKNGWKKMFAAFPELHCELENLQGKVFIKLYWNQQVDLLPNPLGQLIKLENSIVSIKSGGEELLSLSLNDAPPYGDLGKISYRARPYELTIEIDEAVLSQDADKTANLIVEARIDGQEGTVSLFNKELSSEKTSDVSAKGLAPNTTEIAVTALGEGEIGNQIAKLDSLPEDAKFSHFYSFSVVDEPGEKNKSWPEELSWSDTGTLWVVDSQRRKILNFSEEGQLLLAFGKKGNSKGEFILPVALLARGGKVYVSDITRHCLHKFAEDGSFLRTIESAPEKGIYINTPGGMTIRNSELWVTDRSLARVNCFDQEGKYLGGFGGDNKGLLVAPMGVRADKDGLLVLERNGIIKKFTPMGEQIAAFQTGCLEARGFDVDCWGTIWVCDAARFEVVRYNLKGRILATLTSPPGPLPWVPTGVAVRQDGLIAVTDAQNKQIHLFSVAK